MEIADFIGRSFKCPVCQAPLRLKSTCKQKPYCMCLQCGIQIFFRGQQGIQKLYRLIRSENADVVEVEDDFDSFAVYNRLQHLKQQKVLLEEKQTGFSFDRDRQRVIEILGIEIDQLRSKLEKERKELESNSSQNTAVSPRIIFRNKVRQNGASIP